MARLSPDERAELALLPLLDGAEEQPVAALTDRMRPGRAQPGEVLGREGEPGDVFWLLLEGRVSVTTRGAFGPHVLAEAGPGSILGELALLRGGPRTATVTALDPCRYLCGGADAMVSLLAIDVVRARLRRLASSRLAQDARPVTATMRDGTSVQLRPLLPSDRPALDSAVSHLSRQSIRQRFFTAGTPSTRLLDYLVAIDYVDHFAWVGLDGSTQDGVGVGRYIRSPGATSAEMAFTTVDHMQGRGIGTLLLGAVGVAAREAGVDELVAYVMEENSAMRAVFAKADARVRFHEPGVVHVTVDPGRAAGLLDPATAVALAAAVHDVVTAASVALA